MPVLIIASAVSRINGSLTLHANLFQLFQPMGGVAASCGDDAPLEVCAPAIVPFATATKARRTVLSAHREILIAPSIDLDHRNSFAVGVFIVQSPQINRAARARPRTSDRERPRIRSPGA